ITNINSIYSTAFSLINNERVEGFTWLVKAFDKLRRRVNIIKLEVIITDFNN
ncbi:hypothetical protein B0T20DRAFT_349874, partial [Sordaria brevicollis]